MCVYVSYIKIHKDINAKTDVYYVSLYTPYYANVYDYDQ